MPTLDLATAAALKRARGGMEALGWQPNPCHVCSPDFSIPNPVRGAGLDPADPSRPCPKCGRLHHGIRGYGPQAVALTSLQTEIFFGGAKGGAKGQATYLCRNKGMICTPSGFQPISSLRVGSPVSNPDGSVAEILGVYPQGVRDLYRVSFIDGASTIVTDDHIWLARVAGRSINHDQRHFPYSRIGNWRNYTTLQLIRLLDRAASSASTITPNVHIPLTSPVPFNITTRSEKAWEQLPPYLLGVVLGAGGSKRNQLFWSTPDPEIPLFIKEETGREIISRAGNEYAVSCSAAYAAAYRRFGLEGRRSFEKFIPDAYLRSPLPVRWSLINGLMDTAGTIDDRGRACLISTSRKLAEQVQYILRSLGFQATLSDAMPGSRRDDKGERIECRDHFNAYIQGRAIADLFRLPRKRERVSRFNGGLGEPNRRLINIEKVGREESACIKVSNPNSLYLTDDFIVTHNTDAMTIWMVSGNPSQPDTFTDAGGAERFIPENAGYYLHPSFRGLVLRRTGKDLRAWIELAKRYYSKIGASYANYTFRFPSGAIIWTGHLDDEDAYESYAGFPELHRIAIEEVTQIPSLTLYEHLLSCLRTSTPNLRPQIFLTANPIGPGVGWVKERFVKVAKPGGGVYQPGETIVAAVKDHITGEDIETTRVFIRSGIQDNPYILADRPYMARLSSLDPKLKRAYLDGDWEAMIGNYFDAFRPNGPLQNEPPNACHVLTADRRPALPYWWTRAMGGDWGFVHECSYHWGAADPDTEQIYIYREFGGAKLGGEEQGIEIARRSLPDLNAHPSHSLTLWYSRDAFQRRSNDYGVRSFVELLARGIAKIIGDDAVYIPEFAIIDATFSTPGLSPVFEQEYLDWKKALQIRKDSGITIRMCNSNRILGWSYMRDLMNWNPPILDEAPKFDYDTWMQLGRQYSAAHAADYAAQFTTPASVYPKFQIIDCPRLAAAIPEAQHDGKNPEDVAKAHFTGMDRLDSCRYLLLGLRDTNIEAPLEERTKQRVEEWMLQNPNASGMDKVWLRRHLEQEAREEEAGEKFNPHRAATRAAKMARKKWRDAMT